MATKKKAKKKASTVKSATKNHVVWTIRASEEEDKKLQRYMKKTGLTAKVTALKAALRKGDKIL